MHDRVAAAPGQEPEAALLRVKANLTSFERLSDPTGQHDVFGSAGHQLAARHHDLSTFGLLKEEAPVAIRGYIEQLVGGGLLAREGDPYPVLRLTPAGTALLRGEGDCVLYREVKPPASRKRSRSGVRDTFIVTVDSDLFDVLREVRLHLARERGVPPYVIFHDGVLRELARARPSTPDRMRRISGVGEAKMRDFSERFLAVINDHCQKQNLPMDVATPPPAVPLFGYAAPATERTSASFRVNPVQAQAFALFREGAVIEDVMHQTQRKRPTVVDYLADFIRGEKPASIATWVADDLYQRILNTARLVGTEKLKPIYLALGEKVEYDDIRLVVAHILARAAP